MHETPTSVTTPDSEAAEPYTAPAVEDQSPLAGQMGLPSLSGTL